MTIEYKEYHLFWSGPYSIKFDETKMDYQFDAVPQKIKEKECIYALYGQHPIFGQNSLLYIGRTERTACRLKEHFNKSLRFRYQLGVSVRIGQICDVQNNPILQVESCIDKIEQILIASNIPPMNRKSIDCPAMNCQGILVYNFEERGDIMPISSGNWFVYE